MSRRVGGGGLFALFLSCIVSCTVVLPYAESAIERGPDLCSNGIDDDLDDALDCEVPECARFCPPPVRPPDPPVLNCRAPWVTEPLAAREGLSHCTIPDGFPDRITACTPVPSLPCDPPFCVYVRAGATGGTGTEADPVATVAEAIEIGLTVRLQPGVYHEAIVVPRDAVIEACDATIEDDGDPSTPLIDVRAGHLELYGLSLHLDAPPEGAIAPAIRVGVAARVTANHVAIDGASRIVLEDDAVFAASSSTLQLDVGATTCPGELDVCGEIECAPGYECRPSLETCTNACRGGCPSDRTCDQLTGECRDLPDLCGVCGNPTACRAGADAFRCVPRPCEHAIALGRGAAISLVDSRVRSDARVLLAASTAAQGGPGRIVFDHTLLELASGALGALTGLRCSLEVTDSVVRAHGPRTGPWLKLFDSARAVIQGTELDVSDGSVLEASGNADAPEPWTSGVLLTDVLIHGWDPSRPAPGATSALSLSGATLSAERVAVLGSPGSAFVVGTSSMGGVDAATGRITLRDVLVTDAGGALFAPSIPAVGVFGGSCLQAGALRIEGASGGGLVIASTCAHDIEDVTVIHRPRLCTEPCDDAVGTGIVLSASADGTMRRFEVDRVDGCALSRSVLARMSLSGGFLRRSSVGLCLQDSVPQSSYDRHADGLVLRDNETDLVVGVPPAGEAHCLPAVAARCGTPFEPD